MISSLNFFFKQNRQNSAQNHHFVIRNVVEKLNRNSAISTNALEGMKVVDIIERIYAERDRQWKK